MTKIGTKIATVKLAVESQNRVRTEPINRPSQNAQIKARPPSFKANLGPMHGESSRRRPVLNKLKAQGDIAVYAARVPSHFSPWRPFLNRDRSMAEASQFAKPI